MTTTLTTTLTTTWMELYGRFTSVWTGRRLLVERTRQETTQQHGMEEGVGFLKSCGRKPVRVRFPASAPLFPCVYWVEGLGRLTLIRLLKRFDSYRIEEWGNRPPVGLFRSPDFLRSENREGPRYIYVSDRNLYPPCLLHLAVKTSLVLRWCWCCVALSWRCLALPCLGAALAWCRCLVGVGVRGEVLVV